MKSILNIISVYIIGAYATLIIGNYLKWWFMDWHLIITVPLGMLVVIALIAGLILYIIGRIHMKRNPDKYPKPTYNRKINNSPHKGD